MTENGAPHTSATTPHIHAPSQKTQGYVTLACVVAGMILFGLYGPNDIWTSLLVGAVFGGIAARPLLNAIFGAWNWIERLKR